VRRTLLTVVVFVTLAAWWITYSQTQNMGLLMRLGVPMSLGMEGWADFTSFAVFTGMWAVMMIAMMLPASYPIYLLCRSVYRKQPLQAPAGAFLFSLGYFFVWSATGVLFYGGYVLLGYMRARLVVADSTILRMGGIALIVSGVYQWSRLKASCLKHCQSPLGFLLNHWRSGRIGAARMGAEHGLYCFGCCWGLMLVLFAMGVMHLGWMAGISAFILIERLMPSAVWIQKVAGLVLVTAGTMILFWPDLLVALSSQITIR
jgi:predicted metal-binding membrane protein